MGRTVKVEGQIAATTTSDHVARTVGPDMRMLGQTPVQRKNWIETTHLSKDRTTNTKFSGGWVWKSDTLCGLPPLTHDMPADSLPGQLNGFLINMYAEAQPGQGAQTVYVEGKKVIRYDDKTYQNKRNSKGKIINAEELAAYLAEPLKPDFPPPKPKPKVPTTTAKPAAGNQGTATPDGGKGGAARGATQGTDPTKDCTVLEVSMSRDGKIQSSDPKSKQPGWLWLLDSSTLTVDVKGEKCCDKHPLVTFGNDAPKKGMKTTFNPAVVFRGQERIVLSLIFPGSGALPPRPVQTQLTVQSCKAQFNRGVMVMGARENASIYIGNRGTKWAGGAALLQKLPLIGKVIDEVKLFEGGIDFGLAWKEEDWWAGALTVTVTGQLTLISVKLKDYTIPFWTAVPGGQIITVLTEIAEFFNVTIVAGFTIGLSGALTLKSDLALKLTYGTERAFGSGGVTGEAQIAVTCGLTLKGGDAFEAFGGVEGSITLSGEWKGEGWPGVVIKTFWQASIKAKLECTIGLGRWFQAKGKKEFTLWESQKNELSPLNLFTAAAGIPSGGKP